MGPPPSLASQTRRWRSAPGRNSCTTSVRRSSFHPAQPRAPSPTLSPTLCPRFFRPSSLFLALVRAVPRDVPDGARLQRPHGRKVCGADPAMALVGQEPAGQLQAPGRLMAPPHVLIYFLPFFLSLVRFFSSTPDSRFCLSCIGFEYVPLSLLSFFLSPPLPPPPPPLGFSRAPTLKQRRNFLDGTAPSHECTVKKWGSGGLPARESVCVFCVRVEKKKKGDRGKSFFFLSLPACLHPLCR